MQVDVVENLIYLVTHGSRAYGLHRPDSDYDVKGVLVVPNNILFGYTTNFEQSINNQDLHNYLSMKDVDSTVYGLQKFMKLAADCNPNIIEVLWVDDDDVLFQETAGKLLRKHRDLFISLKAKYTFSGYAHAQLKRIETHRRWLLYPPEKAPQRADFGLPDHEKLVSNDALGTVNKLEEGGHTFSTDLMEAIKKEKRYATALTQWNQYQNWKKTRNPKRAEMEAKYGYDLKHACHLTRLLCMCVEILQGKGVLVNRKKHNGTELRSILNGGWSYDRLIGVAKDLEAEADDLYECNPAGLPRGANHKKLNELCIEIQETYGK